mmetsp:Transcript_13774/g.37216  ORF Transcript_13774/g.37216 Transcript_13774/m.37216 type:complete len:188 (-) Transcript_13774:560-1123(-)|eukprot:CAMPEP_0202353190 /NCGR_PEP_ID=MMETSP1126-20121109/9059_1 /ASSEMBLY_ACC=CAM_ASM_000457 /TAXON_ID=3047 /ORGANISM="Dunaliella tertiolecta, Strain CCMP1320" /LENGTH=187 /DNA_ID=CAMNT_0048945507 /DNA_START=164 /DNA_END=727 /DNA_ORIENTATION=-
MRSLFSDKGDSPRESRSLSGRKESFSPRERSPLTSFNGSSLDEKEKIKKGTLTNVVNNSGTVCLLFLSLILLGVYLIYNTSQSMRDQAQEIDRLSTSIRIQSLDYARLETKSSKCSQDLTSLGQRHSTLEAALSKEQSKEMDLQNALQAKVQQVHTLESQVVAFEQQLKNLVAALHKLEQGQTPQRH